MTVVLYFICYAVVLLKYSCVSADLEKSLFI
jgi:hypothetical protein